MTATEPAWKKFLKLKAEVPVQTANIADSVNTSGTKRKREALEPQNHKASLRKTAAAATPVVVDPAEKKVKANKQKKKAKTKIKRSKKDEADSKAAHEAALQYLSLYHSARSEWKFQKARQNYLLKHLYDSTVIPDDRLGALMGYVKDLQGGAKDRCLDDAKAMATRYEKQNETTNGETDQTGESAETTGNGTTDDKEEGQGEEQEEEEKQEDVTDEQYSRAQEVVKVLTTDVATATEKE